MANATAKHIAAYDHKETDDAEAAVPKHKKLEEFLLKKGIKVKDGKVATKDLSKVYDVMFEFEEGLENEKIEKTLKGTFGVHLSDWNMQDKAYKFPRAKLKELIKHLDKNKPSKEDWDFFFSNAKATRGVEDMDVFLDYSHPKECMEEWKEYFEGSKELE